MGAATSTTSTTSAESGSEMTVHQVPPPPPSAMSQQQLARAEALLKSRAALSARNLGGTSAVDAMDLVAVARYIETGEDPWPTPVTPIPEES